MGNNSRAVIWIEEVLMLFVAAFGIWEAMKGRYITLLLVAAAAFVMYRQFRILRSLDAADGGRDDV